MSETNKTIADIIAEMRRWADECVHNVGRDVLRRDAQKFCDRIEAAWKREKAEVEASALMTGGMVEASRHKQGNAAAMREAANATIEAIKKTDLCDYVGFETERCKGCDYYLICEAVDRLRQALSASSRNCDRLSADQCKKMFEHEMGIYLLKEATDRDREIARCTAYGVIDALYAERKGESNGK